MPLDVTLLILRVAIALALYAFIGALFYFLVQDIKSTQGTSPSPTRAALALISADDLPVELNGRHPLRARTIIGRAPTCDIVLPEPFASLEHAAVTLRDDQWWLEDLGSRNGTYLNGDIITDRVILATGDRIVIGRITLEFTG
ncbi:MAG: FHA domain-containing protein [Chloroflexi bacterium]|nr:FHA domain-containing protein [Chloroflexota bacterium]